LRFFLTIKLENTTTSGKASTKYFCGDCGASLAREPELYAPSVFVCAGTSFSLSFLLFLSSSFVFLLLFFSLLHCILLKFPSGTIKIPVPANPSFLSVLSTIYPLYYLSSLLSFLSTIFPLYYLSSLVSFLSTIFSLYYLFSLLSFLSTIFPLYYLSSLLSFLSTIFPLYYLFSLLPFLSTIFSLYYLSSLLSFLSTIFSLYYLFSLLSFLSSPSLAYKNLIRYNQ
jgi:hypothetical protein